MRTLLKILAITLLPLGAGCATVTSAVGGNISDTGEAWWVKTTYIPILQIPVKSQIYYCPAPATGPARCQEARMIPPS